ncbi:hypothetical protein I7I50_06252 [Histoplasma capsulatum G186AR]|uniref:Uncharacterized protein n=1 Tax=Ajellomyces capsulatus TaxID=5037 RepID=A0A8H7Z2W4_AJECA|nr:hypothetical protein I7I52_10675 [Histoplasma capsulatum]QSS67237.1 hypothetical protein I7I50_06252 [Histoplasma capsulatum G186AR]
MWEKMGLLAIRVTRNWISLIQHSDSSSRAPLRSYLDFVTRIVALRPVPARLLSLYYSGAQFDIPGNIFLY